MKQIVGTVDGFGPADRLVGWARHEDHSIQTPICVRVYYDQTLIAEGQNRQFRDDVGGDFGFELRLSRTLDLASIECGRVRVEASSEVGRTVSLPFYHKLLDYLRQRHTAESTLPVAAEHCDATKGLTDAELLSMLRGYAKGDGNGLRRRIAECLPYLSTETADLILPGAPVDEISMVGLMPGLKSANDVAVVGRRGFLFILRGSNDVYGQHQKRPDDPTVIAKARAWADLFARRQEQLSAQGHRYIQMIIPEKSSALPDLFPVSIQSPTALLSGIEECISVDPRLQNSYIRCLDVLQAGGRQEQMFRQLDTHMSVHGNLSLFSAILRQIGSEHDLSIELTRRVVQNSDLGENFPGVPMREVLCLPRRDQFSAQEAGLVQLEAHNAAKSRYVGSRFVWSNSTSPLPLKAVAFANSFFERGASAASLSWWAARWFREFHFLWSAEVDYDYVGRVKPDLVICQTVERFLQHVPVT